MGYVAVMPPAEAGDGDRPTVWVELGGQLSRLENGQEAYGPSFVALTPSNLISPLKAERAARYGFDESAALAIQPVGSDWTFSASIRYGRSGNNKHVRQQSEPTYITRYLRFHRSSGGSFFEHTNHYDIDPIAARFADTVVKQSESHAIVDFQASRDLGIGLFGRNSLSSLNVGVRFAQFTSKSRINLKENPDWQFKTDITGFHTAYNTYSGGYFSFGRTAQSVRQPYHSFAGNFQTDRSFTGLGPSIAWNSSVPFVGNEQAGELTFDWGVNAALLFGRQKAKTHHQTMEQYYAGYYGAPHVAVYDHDHPSAVRSRGVVVPNIGGFAGFSVKYPNAKVSFGYKADFFFGAMDGGIDVRRTEGVGFHGPYASVSIGLGG